MTRVMIIGCGGSGKSTLARGLSEKLSLPVYHLDEIHWQAGWKPLPKDEWRKAHEELCRKPEWILDGNYGGTMDVRFEAADAIIFLDLPTVRCLVGALWRYLRYRGRSRPDVAKGCPERLTWPYAKWIWTYRRDRRPKILARLRELERTKRVVVLGSRRSVSEYVGNVKRETVSRRVD